MALSLAKKQQLAQLNIPDDHDVRLRIRGFMQRSGVTPGDFAEAIQYSVSSFNLFMRGNYDEHHKHRDNTLAIRAASIAYMDAHDVEHVVVIRGRHHQTEGSEAVRRAALNALQKGNAYVVDGPPGSEKTWSLRQVEREINDHQLGRAVYVYARQGHTPLTFLQECCVAAGVTDRGRIDQLLRKLQFFLSKGRTLLLVDEAQHLNHAALEVLRQLLDLPPYFGVIVAGSHDLSQRLSHWQMEQWRSRVRKTIYLNGPSDAEARRILRSELGQVAETVCSATIAGCMAHAERVEGTGGKPVRKPFQYISARALFDGIERAKEVRETQLNQQKESAA